MTGYDVPAAVEESAKAVQSVAEVAKSFGGFVARVSGSVPEAFFGIIEDKLKFVRGERAVRYYVRAREILSEAGLDPQQLLPPSPSIELPLLAAATLEDRDELVQMWERLLAAAVHPNRRNRVRARHIAILKHLEPLDALVLASMDEVLKLAKKHAIAQSGGRGSGYINFWEVLSNHFSVDTDEMTATIENLKELRMVEVSATLDLHTTGEARNFLSVLAGLP